MKIYIDYFFVINFLFNLILLLGISFILKINTKLIRIFFGTFIGSISIFILFIPLNNVVFFFLKMLFGFFMVIISFKYKNFKYTLNNFLHLMILSILTGGFLYFINIQVGYENIGMIFFTNGNNLNIFILILLAILLILIYIKYIKKLTKKISYFYKVDLYINNKVLKLNGYLDTGNTLHDPYFNKPIIIINNNINLNLNKYIYASFHTLNSKGIMKCYFIDKVYIHNVGYKYNVLIGQADSYFAFEGADIILNKEII